MSDFWCQRLEIAKEQLTALDQALLQFAQDGATQTASFDTGQTRITWTRSEIGSIRKARDELLSEIATLEIRTGRSSGGFYGRPAR